MTIFGAPLRQPDQRSCGAAVLVVERMLRDAAYADLVRSGHPDRFVSEVLGMHRRVTGPVDLAGAAQLPWPPALGTPPWAVARQLSASSGVPHSPVAVPPWRRTSMLARIRAATAAGHPVPLYVGNRVLPRHVVLVLDAELTAYEPARGVRVGFGAEDFVEGRLRLGGWRTPWFAVLPDGRVGA